jgi:nucleotide-binding universal stress UspA family protein
MYDRILVATDGSTLSKKAVRGAIGLASSLGAELVLLHVVPRYPTSYFEGGSSVSSEDVSRIETQWAESGQAIIDTAQQAAEAQGVIMAAAKKHKCGLIVMASHGRKGIKRILLGSETQQVLTYSAIPVLVLR